MTVHLPPQQGGLAWYGEDRAGHPRHIAVGAMRVETPPWTYDWTDPRAKDEPACVTVTATFQSVIPTPEWDDILRGPVVNGATVASVFLDATKRATVSTLAERLRQGIASVEGLRADAVEPEASRLAGKIEGMKVALSYVEECVTQ